MNQIQVLLYCAIGFLVPILAVVAMNWDHVTTTDLDSGRLLYFAARG